MKLILVSAFAASAAAFAPASFSKQTTTALSASPYENEIGVQVPVRLALAMPFFALRLPCNHVNKASYLIVLLVQSDGLL